MFEFSSRQQHVGLFDVTELVPAGYEDEASKPQTYVW